MEFRCNYLQGMTMWKVEKMRLDNSNGKDTRLKFEGKLGSILFEKFSAQKKEANVSPFLDPVQRDDPLKQTDRSA